MIVYVVELEMDVALHDEYLAWLHGHVREMLALPEFVDAAILTRIDPPAPSGRWTATVHYRLRDRAAWDGYLANHAAHMRARSIARFGDRVLARRSVLETV